MYTHFVCAHPRKGKYRMLRGVFGRTGEMCHRNRDYAGREWNGWSEKCRKWGKRVKWGSSRQCGEAADRRMRGRRSLRWLCPESSCMWYLIF